MICELLIVSIACMTRNVVEVEFYYLCFEISGGIACAYK